MAYIDKDWQFHVTHLTLKLISWNHYGALLARPVGKFLIRHVLHKKISIFALLFILLLFFLFCLLIKFVFL